MKYFINKIINNKLLTISEAETAMDMIFHEGSSRAQIAGFLTAIHTRGETRDELIGFVRSLLKSIKPIHYQDILLDTCGTGGDGANTFNISTAAALLLSSAGIKVAKHGGKAVSSLSGSADVLNALDIPRANTAERACKQLNENNFTFLFAPTFNPQFAKISELRSVLGVRTSFNLIGPLLNPAGVQRQIVGVYSKQLLKPVAEVLHYFGKEEVMVVHSEDGLDEFSIKALTRFAHLKSGKISESVFIPSQYSLASIEGKDAQFNADIINKIMSGEMRNQYRDVVILNAAAGFVISGNARTLIEGCNLAAECIDSGLAAHRLMKLRAQS